MTVTKLHDLDDKALEVLCQKEGIELQPGMRRDDLIAALIETYEDERRDWERLHALTIQIEKSKFGASPFPSENLPLEGVPAELPESYEETYCGLLIRDPDWAFCFWEVKGSDWHKFHRDSGFKGFFLQLMENQTPGTNGPMNSTHRIMLDHRSGSRYIQLPKQGYYYQLEIVAVTGNKRQTLSQSSIVFSPTVQDQINELMRIGDPAYLAILEASNFYDTEPVKRLEQHQSEAQKSNPYRLSEWDE